MAMPMVWVDIITTNFNGINGIALQCNPAVVG